jgi:hypothetical protein
MKWAENVARKGQTRNAEWILMRQLERRGLLED